MDLRTSAVRSRGNYYTTTFDNIRKLLQVAKDLEEGCRGLC